MSNKPGRGRPTRYTSQTKVYVNDYTTKSMNDGVFPTIEGLAQYLGVGTRTIYDWETQHGDFSQTIEHLRDIQKQLLITNGLTGSYNTRFAMFLLKANHGMSEKEPLVATTQNNTLNISPELLADALQLMKQEEGD